MRTLHAHLGIFLSVLTLLAAAFYSWRLRTVLVGAGARPVVVCDAACGEIAGR